MYHTEPPTDKTIREWYMNSSRVTACALRNEQTVRAHRPATSSVHYTTSCNKQSSAPEDVRNHRPKHAELTGIINKPFLLHLFGVYIIYIVPILER